MTETVPCSDATMEPVLKAALANLWFVTIHPFDDGDGRIARAIADMSLARSEGSSQRFYSMSAQIREERGEYYRILEQTQRGTMDVTSWMEWFLGCLTRAIEGAQGALSGVIAKARYWEKLRDVPLNERQRARMAGCRPSVGSTVVSKREDVQVRRAPPPRPESDALRCARTCIR